MSSFLYRSGQKQQQQQSPQRKGGVDDVFSEFRSFRNETKRKAETSHSKLLMESPQRQSQVRFQPFGSNSFVSTKNSTSQILQLSSTQQQQQQSGQQQFIKNTRHASNISPQKRSTVGIQQQSPKKSYLYKENLHEQCQFHTQYPSSNQSNNHSHSHVFGNTLSNPISSGLDHLQREIKEISFSKHFNYQVSAAREQSKKKLANLSPSSKRNTFLSNQSNNNGLFQSQSSSNIPPQGLSSLQFQSQLQQSPQRQQQQRRNSQQVRNLNSSGFVNLNQSNKVISYSPTRYSQRLFSPNRLLNRLSSPTESQFLDFEFAGVQNSPKLNFKPSSPLTTQIPGSSTLGGASYALKRSNSLSSGNTLTQLLNDTKNRVKNNNPLSTSINDNSNNKNAFFVRSSLISPQANRTNLNNLNNSSYLSPNKSATKINNNVFNSSNNNNRNSQIFASTKTSYIIDKRAHDLEDYLKTLTPTDFNSLPHDNVEQLIKLSSVIMSKVKKSQYYRASIF